MFVQARLKLTFFYLLIIMLVSGTFSFVMYQSSNRQLQSLIHRLSMERERTTSSARLPHPPPGFPSLEELKELEQRSLWSLITVNAMILVLAGGAGYLLAGKTLQPIHEMLQEQATFITNASHELRTPLTAMGLELEATLMSKKASATELRSVLESSLDEVHHLQKLTAKLLNFDEHRTGISPTIETLHLKKVLDIAIKQTRPLSLQKEMKMVVTGDDALVLSNKDILVESIIILLDNAIKFSPAKSTISASIAVQTRTAVLQISDQGRGIADEDLPHIFDRFYRADSARSATPGYGLGLSLAKQMLHTVHASIQVQSEVGQGSQFSITLPLQQTLS